MTSSWTSEAAHPCLGCVAHWPRPERSSWSAAKTATAGPGAWAASCRPFVLSPFVRQRLTMKIAKENYADLERLAGLIEAGKLTPTVDKTYPLDQTPDAMRHLQAGQARGKIVIAVA